jgi:muconolactone delta-isomerase
MLFLVISEPRPEPPNAILAQRQAFWRWVEPLTQSGEVRSVHARVGRGAVVLFDVADNEALHRRLTEWAGMIPARFDIHPLIEPEAARAFLDGRR